MNQMPVISLAQNDLDALGKALGDSFSSFGFAIVLDHGLDPALVRRGWELTAQLFAKDAAFKQAGYNANIAGARGYTPFKTEIAKGAAHHDLKEFWHIGRTLQADNPLRRSMPDNIWPADMPEFETVFTATLRRV